MLFSSLLPYRGGRERLGEVGRGLDAPIGGRASEMHAYYHP